MFVTVAVLVSGCTACLFVSSVCVMFEERKDKIVGMFLNDKLII